MSDFISNHPILYGFFCIVVIALPQWLQAVWSLFSSTPLLPLIYSKLTFVKIQNFSIQWVVNTLAILMLIYICVVSSQKPTFTSPNDLWNTNQVVVTGMNYLNESVNLDGKKFVDCKFSNVTLVYHGYGPVNFQDCSWSTGPNITIGFKCDNMAIDQYMIISSYLTQVSGSHETVGLFDTNNGEVDFNAFKMKTVTVPNKVQ
jgi:hypothetical protein